MVALFVFVKRLLLCIYVLVPFVIIIIEEQNCFASISQLFCVVSVNHSIRIHDTCGCQDHVKAVDDEMILTASHVRKRT